MGRGSIRARVRQKLSFRRENNGSTGHVYEKVEPMVMTEQTAKPMTKFTMSDEMREALEKVELPADTQPTGLEEMEQIERLEKNLRSSRYNNTAPIQIDYTGIPWLVALRNSMKHGSANFLNPDCTNVVFRYHNTITGYSAMEGLMQTRKAPHPAAMVFQYWNLDPHRKGRKIMLHSHVLSIVFKSIHRKILTSSRPERYLHLSTAKVLWKNIRKYRNGDSLTMYWYIRVLAAMRDLDELQETELPKLHHDISEETRQGGIIEILLQESPRDGLEHAKNFLKTKPEGMSNLVACRELVKHHFSTGDKETAFNILRVCTLTPVAFQQQQRVAWEVIHDILETPEVTHTDAERMIATVVPFFSDKPQTWCEEILETIISKQPNIKSAYRIFRNGANAGLPLYNSEVSIPPPRSGFRGVLKVCSRKGDARVARKIFEFMLMNECRPEETEIHHLMMVHARTNPKMFSNILRWVETTHELRVSDTTLIKTFATLSFSNISDLKKTFTAMLNLHGGVSEALVTIFFRKAVEVLQNPMEAFAELMIFSTNSLLTYTYDDRVSFPLRISSKEVTSAVLSVLEDIGHAANLTILNKMIASCHAQWTTGGYTHVKSKVALIHQPEENLESAQYTSALPVVDAWLLASFYMYDLKPLYLGLPENVVEVVLVHWSVLLWCSEAVRHFNREKLSEGVIPVVTARQYYYAVKSLNERKRELEDIDETIESLAPITHNTEWGGPLRDTIAEIENSSAEPQQLEDRCRNLIENYCGYLPYEAELELIPSECPLRHGIDSVPSNESFMALAESFVSMGFKVTCLVDSQKIFSELSSMSNASKKDIVVQNATEPPVEHPWEREVPVSPLPLTRRYKHVDQRYKKHLSGAVRGIDVKKLKLFVAKLQREAPPSGLLKTIPWGSI